ncbi:hypothetical protein V499_06198 [Pseudogymnoascus sp. VKM F-103]|nr:hypothetical protein V499_06198 [Pseudogymnoascus sp. VKM F-103]
MTPTSGPAGEVNKSLKRFMSHMFVRYNQFTFPNNLSSRIMCLSRRRLFSSRRFIPYRRNDPFSRCPVLTDTVLTDTVLTDTVLTDTVLTDTVLTDTVLTDTVLTDTVLTDTVLTDTVLTDTVPNEFMRDRVKELEARIGIVTANLAAINPGRQEICVAKAAQTEAKTEEARKTHTLSDIRMTNGNKMFDFISVKFEKFDKPVVLSSRENGPRRRLIWRGHFQEGDLREIFAPLRPGVDLETILATKDGVWRNWLYDSAASLADDIFIYHIAQGLAGMEEPASQVSIESLPTSYCQPLLAAVPFSPLFLSHRRPFCCRYQVLVTIGIESRVNMETT